MKKNQQKSSIEKILLATSIKKCLCKNRKKYIKLYIILIMFIQILIKEGKLPMALMKFICNNFNPSLTNPCPFEVVDDGSVIIDEAVAHEVEEHGYQDSPTLRKQIENTLIPAD